MLSTLTLEYHMKKFSYALILTIATLTGCTTTPTSNNDNEPNQYNRIKFKCSAIDYRKEHPFKTNIKDIAVGDTLVFATYGSCSARMATVIHVDPSNNSFVVENTGGEGIKLKVNQEGIISGENMTATEILAKKYFSLGIIKSYTLFTQSS